MAHSCPCIDNLERYPCVLKLALLKSLGHNWNMWGIPDGNKRKGRIGLQGIQARVPGAIIEALDHLSYALCTS
ncbi:hypothetical protein VNO77_27595 [Canavalia gladiata]|uniref:Uncharacterized protein n=1 Tax=Canavalia gladiata TaxID=3824 RepID=A0AAN9KVK6_CANGL